MLFLVNCGNITTQNQILENIPMTWKGLCFTAVVQIRPNKCHTSNLNLLNAVEWQNKSCFKTISGVCIMCIILVRYGLDDRDFGFDSRRGLGIFLFTTEFRTALGRTQPPIQWVPGALSLGVKRPIREAGHSPPSSAEVKEWVELCLHSPNTSSWRGAQLQQSTGTTVSLPLPLPVFVAQHTSNLSIRCRHFCSTYLVEL
jgi:hypothetical protein